MKRHNAGRALLVAAGILVSVLALSCKDGGSSDDGGLVQPVPTVQVLKNTFKSGWWKYEDSGVTCYLYYEADMSVGRAGSERNEYEGTPLEQARKLYSFTDRKVNDCLSWAPALPSWTKADTSTKVDLDFWVETMDKNLQNNGPNQHMVRESRYRYSYDNQGAKDGYVRFYLYFEDKGTTGGYNPSAKDATVRFEVLTGDKGLLECVDPYSNEDNKHLELDGSSCTFTNKLHRYAEDTPKYMNKFYCPCEVVVNVPKRYKDKPLRLRFTVTHPDMKESLVLDATCRYNGE